MVPLYLDTQPSLTTSMRSILVDWLVEVQENFELNHETLYLAVKLVDFYLSKKVVSKEKLQLIGAVSLFIACKFDVSQYNYPKINVDIWNLYNVKFHIDLERLFSMINMRLTRVLFGVAVYYMTQEVTQFLFHRRDVPHWLRTSCTSVMTHTNAMNSWPWSVPFWRLLALILACHSPTDSSGVSLRSVYSSVQNKCLLQISFATIWI